MSGESARHGKPAWKESLKRIHRGEEADRRQRNGAFENLSWPTPNLEAARAKAEFLKAVRLNAELSFLLYKALFATTGQSIDSRSVEQIGRAIRDE